MWILWKSFLLIDIKGFLVPQADVEENDAFPHFMFSLF